MCFKSAVEEMEKHQGGLDSGAVHLYTLAEDPGLLGKEARTVIWGFNSGSLPYPPMVRQVGFSVNRIVGGKAMESAMALERIVQELVPGKQITLAHLIANPDGVLYEKLGLHPQMDDAKSAIGILTISPAETAVIAADLALKAAAIQLGFVDRFSGTLIITGTVSEVEASLNAILAYTGEKLGFAVCGITRT